MICSPGPIPMMIGSELFRQGPRPYAMAVAGVVNWLATFVIAIAFEPVQVGGEIAVMFYLSFSADQIKRNCPME